MKNTYRAGTDIASAPEARQCKSCQRVFGSELHLKYHTKRIHRGDRAPYVCRGCNKPFRRIHELQRHSLQTLTCPASEGSGRSLSFWQAANCCLLCGAGGFRTLAALRRHLAGRRHLNDIAYTCQHCSAGFLMVDELNLHRVTVHGERYIGAAAVRRKRRHSSGAEPMLLAPAQDDDEDECIDEDAITDTRSQSHFSVHAGAAGLKLVLKKVAPVVARPEPAAASFAVVEASCDDKQQHRVVDSAEASDCEYEPASHTTADSGKGLSDPSDESDSDACAAASASTPAPPPSTVVEQQQSSPLAAAICDNRQRSCTSASAALSAPQPTTESTRPPLRLSIVIGRDPSQATATAARTSSGAGGSGIASGRSPAASTVGQLDSAAGTAQQELSSALSAPSSGSCLIKKPRLHLPGGAVSHPGSPAPTSCLSGNGAQPPVFGAELGAFANGSSLLRAPTLVPSSPAAAAGPAASPRPQQPAFALSHRPHVPAFSFSRPHEAFGIKAPSLLPPPPGAAATAAAAAAAVARQSDLFASAGLPSDVIGRMAGSSLLSRRLGTIACSPGSAVLAGAATPAARLVPLSPLTLPAQPASSPALQARLASAAAAATVAAATAAAAAAAASPSHDAGRGLLPPPSPARWPIHSGRQLASPAYSPIGESQWRRQSAGVHVDRSSLADGRTFAAGESPAVVQLMSSPAPPLPPLPTVAVCAMQSPSPSIDSDHSSARGVLDGGFLPPTAATAAAQCIVDHLSECHRLEQPEQRQHAERASSTGMLLHSEEIAVASDLGCGSILPQPLADADRLGVADSTPQIAAAAVVSSPPPPSSASAPARRTRSGSQGSLDSRDSGLDYSPVGDLSHQSAERATAADGGGAPSDGIAAMACEQQCMAMQPLTLPSTPVESKRTVGSLVGDEPALTSTSRLLAEAVQTVSPSCSTTTGPAAAAEAKSEPSLRMYVPDVVDKAAVESAAAAGDATAADEGVERAIAVRHPISCLAPLPPPPRETLIRCVADLSVPSLAVSVPLALLLRHDSSIARRGEKSSTSCDPSRRPCAGAVAVATTGAASGKLPGRDRSRRSSCVVSERFRLQRTSQSEAIGGGRATTSEGSHLDDEDDNDDRLNEQDVSSSSSDEDSCSSSSDVSCSDELDLVGRQPAERLFELHRDGCARTSSAAAAVGQCRFVEDSLYLAHVRAKTCALLLSLFPHLRVGGSFSPHTCDVEDLVETVAEALAQGGGRSSSEAGVASAATTGGSDVDMEPPSLHSRPRLQCVSSQPSARRELGVRLCAVARQEVRRLQRGVCSLVRLALPRLSWDELQADGICTFDGLLDAIVGAN